MSNEPDDRFAERLAVLDEQMASGVGIAAETLIDEPHLSRRLEGALDCLQLLQQVWPRQQDAPLPAMPRVFGRYHVVRELGRGGFGIVFLAEDPQLTRDVAIKVQRPEAVLSPESRKRFLREARASAPLKHPNLVTVYDSGDAGLWCWIASEVVHGPALSVYLAGLQDRSKLPAVRDAVQLVRELAEGVAHAHSQGVLHRDIKPANVLLEPRCESPESLADYRGKLADFGLARSLESETGETRTGARLGTPAYMAPEQVEGRKEEIGPPTDVYGLGVLLYELLSGRPPFAGEGESDVLKQVLLDEPRGLRKARPEIPRDLEAVVFKALEKSPTRRYANARALADDLQRSLNHQSTEARPQNVVQQLLRKARRYPAVCLAAISGLAFMGLLIDSGYPARWREQILDVRTVAISTIPPGAHVAFAPLDPITGEPIAGGVIHAPELSPVSLELSPGDYLVVAALENGRFHEVYRHVPRQGEVPELYAHHYWRVNDESIVELFRIQIPALDISKGMARFADPPSGGAVSSKERTAPFYLDPYECRYSQVKGKPPSILASNGRNDDGRFAAIMSHDYAMHEAEMWGKRLPTNAEYELALKHCRTSSSGERATGSMPDKPGFAPVGQPENDVTDTVPSVIGLRSNVAEWTASVSVEEPANPPGPPYWLDYRFIRGGVHNTIEAVNIRSAEIRERDEAISVFRHATKPGVGFRAARSASPRFMDPPSSR